MTAKADLSPGAWQNATITSPYTAQSETVQYRLCDDGFVRMVGRVKINTALTGSVCLTLPAGFRPLIRHDLICSTDVAGGAASAQLATGGTITLTWSGTPTWVSLSGLMFPIS